MPTWAQWVTFGIALLGAALGILTTWRGLTRDTPRVRVRAYWCGVRHDASSNRTIEIKSHRPESLEEFPGWQLGIEAINIGYVPVHIGEVGLCPWRLYWFQRFREFKQPAKRGVVLADSDKVGLPYKLEPGARMQITFPKIAMESNAIRRSGLVYLMTCDERLFTGGRKLVRAAAKIARSVATNN
jgi:hypothetical protein